MKNKAAKLKSKRKGSENAFGCDLTEHLQNSGHDVPQVLKTCAEFIEKHGIVDGIYRLSGITSNIQRLRQEICSELCPDLTKEVYLQDIHCVGSLCKLYFRELPNPLLTYELYKKFTDAVSYKEEHEQLWNMKSVIKELPIPHFRTLEYLTKHLAHLATLSHQTNMHARNLALVWAPNLLRSKEVEVSTCNGDVAFLEVRVQQSVVEFILNHTDQIFHDLPPTKPREVHSVACGEKYATLPATMQCAPMKLMSLEEAQARSLSPNHPVMRERQRENSLPDTSTAAVYHTVIDLSDSRKFSGKSKKWKSIFSLGRSVMESKGKLSRNGSVFMRGPNMSEKPAIRPSKSMDSLCSQPADDDKAAAAGGSNGIFIPVLKSRTLGSDIDYNLNERDSKWDLGHHTASGGRQNEKDPPNLPPASSSPQQKTLPEQLKVFKGDERIGCQPTSPKNRRMLYSGSTSNGSSRPSFPGSLFPLESSPRHQRKALNISEPFAVSVPLRVSAVINSNSTPCRAPGKERERALGGLFSPTREAVPSEARGSDAGFRVPISSGGGLNFGFTDWEAGLGGGSHSTGQREHSLADSSGGSGCSIYSNSSSFPMENEENQTGGRDITDDISLGTTESRDAEVRELIASVQNFEPRVPSETKATVDYKRKSQASGDELETGTRQEITTSDQLDNEVIIRETSPGIHHNVAITDGQTNTVDEKMKSSFTNITDDKVKLSADVKRRSSLPANTQSAKELNLEETKNSTVDHSGATVFKYNPKPFPERLMSCDGGWNYLDHDVDGMERKSQELQDTTNSLQLSPFLHLKETDILQDAEPWTCIEEDPVQKARACESETKEPSVTQEICVRGNKKVGREAMKLNLTERNKGRLERLSTCLSEQHLTLDVLCQDDADTLGNHLGGLDQVEPWEDFCSAKQWVTSPLHSPILEDYLRETMQCQATKSIDLDKPNADRLPDIKKVEAKEAAVTNDVTSSSTDVPLTAACKLGKSDLPKENKNADVFEQKTKHPDCDNSEIPKMRVFKTSVDPNNMTGLQNVSKGKQKLSQRFHRQTSQESSVTDRRNENPLAKQRPCSLNLDLGHRGVRDISNYQYLKCSAREGLSDPSLELELFLSRSQAPVRRNSAPVSVSSVRTAFMIKTCQAKAVPVIPPKIQYSHVPPPLAKGNTDQKSTPEKKPVKSKLSKAGSAPPLQNVRNPKEAKESCEAPREVQKPTNKDNVTCQAKPFPDLPVLRRKRSANGDTFMDRPRPERSTLLQRSSFRNRPRPQSLILFSPPFPIMDYHAAGDDGKTALSPIQAEVSPFDVYAKELAENLKTPEGVTLRGKMTLPKSGQRLETSTSCFYQPQRRSMIFDNRSNRQNE
ncbi:rho GTPase-activating protein 31 isoform X2 [Triplophysa dalaica]|uniref:rho GTPase-activating protein 31 isoform X2 n=1 Tax=Triplophysa dalaica TaxID=1582913 RepID=UPI0024DF4418|nr:rho GTPase-activating protein 31 isoform X2 [Triplophysa dalaica]